MNCKCGAEMLIAYQRDGATLFRCKSCGATKLVQERVIAKKTDNSESKSGGSSQHKEGSDN